ncbi:MAG: hypothetical protein OEW04_05915, partial [Nitrospirota bacterium]|nr:hypothetical protein [Nitrospirota bacterium]
FVSSFFICFLQYIIAFAMPALTHCFHSFVFSRHRAFRQIHLQVCEKNHKRRQRVASNESTAKTSECVEACMREGIKTVNGDLYPLQIAGKG